jgi:PKD repeat protein
VSWFTVLATGRHIVRYKRATRYVIILALAFMAPIFVVRPSSQVHAAGSYTLAPVYPGYAQENDTIGLVLTVTGANKTTYLFRFYVQDPSSKTYHSINETYDNSLGQYSFNLIVVYPSTSFSGKSSLVGQYQAWVDQFIPVLKAKVATSSFYYLLTDNSVYERTQTVKIQGSGYNVSETVTVTIRLATSPTPFFSQSITATSAGLVMTSWKIPVNATIDYYVVTLTGTSTIKNPADIQAFLVGAATMTISSLTSSKSTYQRTETMSFSFEPVYPDGSNSTTGTAIVTLTDPTGAQTNLTATYNGASRTFTATYKTSVSDNIGTWNATMASNSFNDGYGNTGPNSPLTSLPQLNAATLTISASVTSYVAIGQQLKLNATISYPDGSALQSGSVGAYLLYSGTPTVNDTVPIVFDSGLQFWIGSYALQSTDPGGLWSLYIKASDSSTPANTGFTTKVVTTQDHPPSATFSSSTTSTLTGTPISFNGTASYDSDGTVTSWSWNFGDGSSALGSTTTHTYTTAGNYTVTLTVTDNSGTTGTTTSQITITGQEPVVSITPSTMTPTSGQTVTISITASDQYGSIVTTKVDWGDGTTATLSGSPASDSHTYTVSGSADKPYTITVTVTNNSGQSTSATSTVTVQPSSNNSSSGNLSLPLYYFGILAIAIAALLAGGFLAFRRHRVTHARLKIDLEAVKSEAGRIENQDFFQSVKDQLKKDKDDK